MADRIKSAFEAAKKPLLVPYLTAGWPAIGDTPGLMANMEEGGADLIELGIPFTDPSADGPVIQRANEQALANGASLQVAFDATKGYRDAGGSLPVVLMGYANPFLRFGADELAGEAAGCGVDGILAVDWPPGPDDNLGAPLAKSGIDRIVLVSPTTTDERAQEIGKHGSGYAYYVSMQGVTGSGGLDLAEVCEAAPRVRESTGLPVAVGFGVRTPRDCADLGKAFDAVVVGTKLLEVVKDAGTNAPSAVKELVASMKGAMA